MPRAFSSGALSIWSYAVYVAPPVSASTFVIAAVSDVFPWSTWPIVPTLQCGLSRLNFSLPMAHSVRWQMRFYLTARGIRARVLLFPAGVSAGHLRLDLVRNVVGDLFVMVELHRELGAALAHGPQRIDVTKHI